MDVDGLEHLLGELHRDLHRGKGIAEVLTNLQVCFVETHIFALETRQKTHIETHAWQSSRFSMKLVCENFFEALARLKGLWSMHGLP